MRTAVDARDGRRGLWRSRWAAIGAAVAVSLGGGGFFVANASVGTESTTVMIDPVRVLDSRDPVDVGLSGPFVSATSQKMRITGSIPTTTGDQTVIPTGATGVLLNVTPTGATANGFISIRPGDATGAPTTSSLNFTVGAILPNAVLVALPTTGAHAGEIDITYDAYGDTGPATEILIDVVGYTTSATLDALQTQIAAKANRDAVNTALFRQNVWTAEVEADGAKSSPGNYTAVRTGVGHYLVTWNVKALGLAEEHLIPVATTKCDGHTATIGFRYVTTSNGELTSLGVRVRVHDQGGADQDCDFFLMARQPGPDIPTPPVAAGLDASLESSGRPAGVCTTQGDTTICVDER